MYVRLCSGLLVIFLTTALAISAEAAPTFATTVSRAIATGANADRCDYSDYGYSCLVVSAYESYDIQGNYENTWSSTLEDSFEYDPDTGGYMYGFRVLECSLPLGAISASQNRVTVEALLDPNSPNCFSFGEMYIFDPSTGEQWIPYAFDTTIELNGVWEDPLQSAAGPVNRRMQTYDYATGSVVRWNYQCHESFGDLMQKGGFSVNDVFVPFQGIGGSGWSSFYISKCNNKNNPYF